MKKMLLFGICILFLSQIGLFLYSIHYQRAEGDLTFYEVITTEPLENQTNTHELSQDIQSFYIDTALETLLCQCKFHSVSFSEAVHVVAQSARAAQVGTLLGNGKKVSLQNRTYIMGQLLFFDDNSVYYAVMYSQENLRLTSTGFSYTVYRVTPNQELLTQYRTYINDVPAKNLLRKTLSLVMMEYTALLKEPKVLAPYMVFVVVLVVFYLYMKRNTSEKKERELYYDEKT